LQFVAEEIADLGRRDRREVHSRVRVLIMDLIKSAIQPERRESSTWLSTINTQRVELEEVFVQSPSLRRYAAQAVRECYPMARRMALPETGVQKILPEECPFTVDQVLALDWLPAEL
jgi:hypothetical protein